jgi:hypothetical protein
MPQRTYDRVYETTSSTGTGNVTLAGAVAQFVAFSARFLVGASPQAADLIYYTIKGQTGTEWEVGKGYLSASGTLVRYVVFSSSNADALVNFSAGIKDVFCTIPAERVEEIFTKGQSVALASGLAMP